MQNRQGFYDIFVSYSRKDNERGLIEAILAQLGEEFSRFTAGKHLEMFFDKQDIRNGADWQLRIKESLAQSNLFLAFISPEYFASEWCRKEWRLWIDVEIARHILTKGVRPIYIVEVPGLIGRSQLSDPEIVQIITNLCIVSGQSQERLEAEGPSVLNRLKRSNIQNQALWKVESFREAGVGRLKREDVTHILQGLAKDLQEHSDLLAAANASENSIPPYNSKFSGRMDDLIKVRE